MLFLVEILFSFVLRLVVMYETKGNKAYTKDKNEPLNKPDSIKVALSIGKLHIGNLLFGGHSSKSLK